MPCQSSLCPSASRRSLSRIALFGLTSALTGSLTPAFALAEEDTVYLGEITISANYWQELARKSAVTATVLGTGGLAQYAI